MLSIPPFQPLPSVSGTIRFKSPILYSSDLFDSWNSYRVSKSGSILFQVQVRPDTSPRPDSSSIAEPLLQYVVRACTVKHSADCSQGITVIALGVATAGDALLSGTMLHAIKRSRASMTCVRLLSVRMTSFPDCSLQGGERVSGGPLAALPLQYRCVSSHLHRTSVFH